MSVEVSFAVLFAALLHASWNALIKGSADVLLKTAAIVFTAGLVTLPFIFVLPPPAPASWPYLAGSLLTHVLYYYFMVQAYRAGDLSLAYPLMRGTAPLITALLGAALLRELPGPITLVGIVLISVGIFALSYRPLDHKPARAAVGFALTNALVIAIYTVIDGTGARLAGNVWSYIVWLFVLDMIPFTLFVLATRRRDFIAFMAAQPCKSLAGGAASAGAYAIALWAMTKAPVAMVAALRETSVLFAALIGARMLHERLTPLRWLGVAVVVAGVMALKLA
ncbi:MAG: EamA family transporter [Betaproteobacteria bacterium]